MCKDKDAVFGSFQEGKSSKDEEAFKASWGWFKKFKKFKEVLIMWEKVQNFVEKHHNKAVHELI